LALVATDGKSDLRREFVEGKASMKQLVFSHVSAAGFAAFDVELSSGEWACVDSSRFEGGPRRVTKPIEDGPTLVVVKLRLKWAIAALLQAIEVAGDAKECDRHWDTLQKQLASILAARTASNDLAKRSAAQRLQQALLFRSGIGQTKFPHQQEVDFGRQQVRHVSEGQGAADVALLGLVPLMLDIAASTEALATSIGYGTSTKTLQERKVSARAACAATFASAAYWLSWIAEYGSEKMDRERASSLLAPLEQLAERHNAPAPITLRSPLEATIGA
jgi:hypothetical protein